MRRSSTHLAASAIAAVLIAVLSPVQAGQSAPAADTASPPPDQAALDAAVADLAAPKPAPPPRPARPCSQPEYRQFDYWLGEWDVFAVGSDRLVANSRIESKYGGCAIRENWMPMNNSGGGSLNNYDQRMGKWRQAWVDATGTRVDFEGGLVGDAMELTGIWRDFGGPGKDVLVKMRYEKLDGGTVRQWGQQSADGGVTWSTSFDLIYKKRKLPLQP